MKFPSVGHYLGIVFIKDMKDVIFCSKKSEGILIVYMLFDNKEEMKRIYLGSTPVSRTIKIATPKGVAIFMVAARNFTCSAEMNSACAKVLAGGQNTCTAQKRLRPEGRLGKARDLCRMHMAKWVKDAGNKITVF